MSGDRFGVSFGLTDDLGLVERADRLGYDTVFAPEGQGRAVFPKLTRWAGVTDRIRLATGIVNIYSRTPSAIAQEIATLDEYADGRAVLGLGAAHPGVVEEFHGVEFDRPLSRMAEYITLVRRYLDGDASPFDGEFVSPGRTSFWEAFTPVRSEIPIYNAAIGPANIRLTGQYADGWLPHLFPLDRFDEAREWLATGAARSGRALADVDVAMYLVVSTDPDEDVARERAARHVATYLRDIPGFYGRVAVEAGFEAQVEAVTAAPSLEAGAERIEDDYLDLVTVTGSPEAVREAVEGFRAAGVDMPVLRAPNGTPREGVVELLELFAPDPS